ncbi:Oidioi.mRNA.OKI2018_I69.chr2.g4570.t1.cds [Oikopleura dioica]|uniref:Oidioi.mRNA.OKI2018_I69.chr2.g4570.t1.cds n=1 Tax=Oikopleura dioica TaxID=34765 RepID=A0ABN7SXU8_OIKDI|nr:Oidioi.mRNA.OKI2018_I69.chr2.g4570.t1.cds [Oikopleura dioica]
MIIGMKILKFSALIACINSSFSRTQKSTTLPKHVQSTTVRGLKYYLYADPVTFLEAVQLCDERGQTLANISDRIQQSQLAIRHWQRLNPWIGIVNFQGSMRWVSDFSLVNDRQKRRNWSYNDVQRAKRHTLHPSECSAFMSQENYGVWKIDNCERTKRPYICHRKI